MDAGEPAWSGLAHLLHARSRLDEAEQAWRAAATAGESHAYMMLAQLLQERGRLDEAELAWRDAVATGDSHARGSLSGLLEDQGKLDEAELVLRDGIDAGQQIRVDLAKLLHRQNRHDEAEMAWRAAVSAHEHHARLSFANYLDETGRSAEAEGILRDGIVYRESTTPARHLASREQDLVHPKYPDGHLHL
ncbi:tetratricopeptide repeat protein [Phytohabitans sp. LJ34]|uniref:tetratricopeptide repeat protein n=1 Tax=Phytohabitans sp. LJ34 TaxID=3452217 RepID=UPI003F889154